MRLIRALAVIVVVMLGLADAAWAQTPPPPVQVGTNCVAAWTAPTTNTDGSAITNPLTYNLYFSLTATPPVSPQFTGITGTTFNPCKALAAGTYTWWVTAVEQFAGSTSESALSAPFPAKLTIPGVPTNLGEK